MEYKMSRLFLTALRINIIACMIQRSPSICLTPAPSRSLAGPTLLSQHPHPSPPTTPTRPHATPCNTQGVGLTAANNIQWLFRPIGHVTRNGGRLELSSEQFCILKRGMRPQIVGFGPKILKREAQNGSLISSFFLCCEKLVK